MPFGTVGERVGLRPTDMQTANMSLRTYRADDLDEIVRIENECFPYPIAYSREHLRESFESPAAVGLVAEVDGLIAGFVLGDTAHDRPDGWISSLDVASGFRRRGIARNLMLGAETEFARKGCRRVWLEVSVSNVPATRLYETLGYKSVRRIAKYYADGTDAWRLKKRLGK
jgi:ribosomal-protein-alanine N-acetyltransferase